MNIITTDVMNIITTEEQLNEMVAHYLTQDAFAYDVETVGDHRVIPAVNEVSWISFATHGRGDVIPLGHPNGDFISEAFPLTGQGEKRVLAGLTARPSDHSRDKKKAVKTFSEPPEQLFPAQVFKALKPLFFNENILTIGHNLVFDLSSVAKYYDGAIPDGPYFDTLMASFLYDNKNKGRLGLDDCLERELGFKMVKGIGHMVEIYSFSDVAKYAYLDAKYTFLLWKLLVPKLTAANVNTVMNLEMDVLRVLCDMKLVGAPIDTVALQELNDHLEVEIEHAKSEVYRIAGRIFNMNSNNEKQYVLYGSKEEGCRGLKTPILTGQGEKTLANMGEEALTYKDYSVSAEALEPLRDKDELCGALLDYADLSKLQSTYVVPYLGGAVTKTVNGKSKVEDRPSMLINGKLYGDFIQWGAETGRFSSRNPNLQNVPAPNKNLTPEKDYGTLIRNLFWAPTDYKLIVADYSQIEPRVLASMSNDPILMGTYTTLGVKGDIYTTIGETMGVDRKAGKVLVLAMMYGVGPDKIATQINCSVKDARKLITDFSEKFPDVEAYKSKVIGLAKKLGYITTIMNRRRYLPDINSRQVGFRAGAERQAFNTRIQGSAADIIKLAMIRAHDMLPKESKLILTVHDELVTMTPDHLVEESRKAIQESMEGISLSEIKVPLIADIKVVQKWGEAK
jgi:DNA polymerase I-like protein with 3'-5' exonuclease and polymerase domains